MTSLPWNFEPCDPEGAIDPHGTPWPHAVRGRKPAGRVVYGYGYSEPMAWHDAEQKAKQYDAREVVGPRGEAIQPVMTEITLENVRRELEEWSRGSHEWTVPPRGEPQVCGTWYIFRSGL